MRFQSPRGTEDLVPTESHRWQRLESAFREVAGLYGYLEIRTPTFEEIELFTRSVGETSDIVTKEMYDFKDKGGRTMALKPEGTAGVLRATIQHNLCPPGTVGRLFYLIPIFRYERPQKGRYRESHQVGLELIGSASAAADAEIIEVIVAFYRALGLQGIEVSLNSLGREGCRTAFRHAVLGHMRTFLMDQSDEFRARAEKNPLRLLDSKDEAVRGAIQGLPPITDFLEPEGRQRFELLQELLTRRCVAYRLDPSVVRGLDYYTDTVFEVFSSKLGAQSSLCGGGRYDGMMKELGGSDTPCVGVAGGVERALIVLDESGIEWSAPRPKVFVIAACEGAASVCADVAAELRSEGVSVLTDPEQRSLKSQLRQADRARAKWALIVGEDEMQHGTAQLRDLDSSTQEELDWQRVKSLLGGRD
jgi:histidyl-tRNA synthetase